MTSSPGCPERSVKPPCDSWIESAGTLPVHRAGAVEEEQRDRGAVLDPEWPGHSIHVSIDRDGASQRDRIANCCRHAAVDEVAHRGPDAADRGELVEAEVGIGGGTLLEPGDPGIHQVLVVSMKREEGNVALALESVGERDTGAVEVPGGDRRKDAG